MTAAGERARVLMFELRRPAEAEKVIREGLAASPGDAYLLCLLSHSLRRQGDAEGAAAEARAAAAAAPDWGYAHATVAWALEKTDAAAAARAFAEAIRLQPDVAEYYAGLSQVRLNTGDYAVALAAADAGLRQDPRDVWCMNCRAIALRCLRRYAEAVEQLEAARSIDPVNAYTRTILGDVWRDRGVPTRALGHYLAAARLDPSYDYPAGQARELVSKIGFQVVGAGLVLAAGLFLFARAKVTVHWPSVAWDRIGNSVGAMFAPLLCLLCRDRFARAVSALVVRGPERGPFSDPAFAGRVAGGLAAGVLVSLAFGWHYHGPVKDVTPNLAAAALPTVPLVAWLDWRRRNPVLARVLALAATAVPVGICAYYVQVPDGPGELSHLFAPLLLLVYSVIVLGNWSDADPR